MDYFPFHDLTPFQYPHFSRTISFSLVSCYHGKGEQTSNPIELPPSRMPTLIWWNFWIASIDWLINRLVTLPFQILQVPLTSRKIQGMPGLLQWNSQSPVPRTHHQHWQVLAVWLGRPIRAANISVSIWWKSSALSSQTAWSVLYSSPHKYFPSVPLSTIFFLVRPELLILVALR